MQHPTPFFINLCYNDTKFAESLYRRVIFKNSKFSSYYFFFNFLKFSNLGSQQQAGKTRDKNNIMNFPEDNI